MKIRLTKNNIKKLGGYMLDLGTVALAGIFVARHRDTIADIATINANTFHVQYREPYVRVVDDKDEGYDRAVSAISSSNMFSSDKREAIKHLKKNQSDIFYEAVSKVALSNMFSSDIRNAIIDMNKAA